VAGISGIGKAMRDGVKPQNLLSIVQFLQDPEIRNARDYVIETVPKKNEKTAF
jgi:hypothetical protein